MRAGDLMRGDWVATFRFHRPFVQVEDIIGNAIITRESEYESEEIDESEIFEILITPEILKKNGFVYIKQEDCYIYNARQTALTLYDNSVNVNAWTMSAKCFEGRKCRTIIDNYKLQYTYELQHALKICRVNNNIKP